MLFCLKRKSSDEAQKVDANAKEMVIDTKAPTKFSQELFTRTKIGSFNLLMINGRKLFLFKWKQGKLINDTKIVLKTNKHMDRQLTEKFSKCWTSGFVPFV